MPAGKDSPDEERLIGPAELVSVEPDSGEETVIATGKLYEVRETLNDSTRTSVGGNSRYSAGYDRIFGNQPSAEEQN